ncbi:hypothetical protein GQ651_08515 [Alphaproteobacteria bacterium GH1-50]|uniref:Pol beta superfamily nucleotidyltransferase in conflict systems domain-containing protein n=1 Tax=Kangsaoukella pontilimi TaxID=2691042 RepID=A0A7C9IGE7_9RHOB|nr:hypothetical protein [Kangsaoukella pontilimi]MXQ07887.1 hypothetical protein [Kangsaoukella pontilimi]
MVEKAIHLKDVQNVIVNWLDKYDVDEIFDHTFIFGSLINRDGRHFVPQGSMASDVDLVLRLGDHLEGANSRFEAILKLRSIVPELEHETAKVLGRKSVEPIYSILPITSYEIHQCIHKGHDPKLFMSNLFLDARTGERLEAGLTNYVDYDYHFENLEPFSVIRLSQSYRNRYLRCDHLGVYSQGDFDGDTAFPKEVMRSAALLRFYDGKQDDGARRTDLEEGNRYISRLIEDLADESDRHRQLWDTVSARSFPRGDTPNLLADQMLLIHEIMYDKARSLVIPSVRDAIREVMESEIGE